MIVFGDSLADSGNLPSLTYLIPTTDPEAPITQGPVVPPPTRYDRGRFSNGRVFSEDVARRLGTYLVPSNTYNGEGGANFAHGGASTGELALVPGGFPVPGILGQVEQYLSQYRSQYRSGQASMPGDPDTIHLIVGGANDYILGILYEQGLLAPPQPSLAPLPSPDPQVVIENLVTAITWLYEDAGARVFVVPNLPDLGVIPLCAPFHGFCESLSLLAADHNQRLEQSLDDLESVFPDATFVQVDFYGLFDRVLMNPSRFGFSDAEGHPVAGPASGCLFEQPFLATNCTKVATFASDQIFWDEEHPTWKAHRLMGAAVWESLVERGIVDDDDRDEGGRPFDGPPPGLRDHAADAPGRRGRGNGN
jgi:phospholipase/lecithinase/hemolysin